MKAIVIFLCVFGLMSSFADTNAQNLKLDFQIEKGTVKDVLELIEQQTGLSFMYDNDVFNVNREISLKVNNKSVEDVLKTLLSKEKLKYEKVNRFIVISADGSNTEQQISISGTVTDQSGSPLPGVTVVVKGTTQGTITDANGNYSLTKIPSDAILVFSFVGMKSQEIPIGGKSTINVTLAEETVGIEEVVAIGYGTMKKSDLTGSVGQVKQSEIQRSSVTSFEQAMQGKVAGVQISQNSGAPGGTMRVRIRGSNSVGYGNDPLYVVDGVPINSGHSSGNIGVSSAFGKNQGSNPLAFINPNDIEAISVLKDASSTAIYGARGANGVIMITTKSGKDGKTDISFDSYYGIQTITKTLDLLNAQEWATGARTFWERFRDGALISRAFTEEQIASLGEGTDWQNAIYRNASVQSYNLSLRGGNSKTNFLLSGAYMDQEGIIINSKFRKGSVRMNLNHKANEKLTIGSTFTTAFIVDNPVATATTGFSAANPIQAALEYAPTLPVKYEDGTYSNHREAWNRTGIFYQPQIQNPVQLAYDMDYEKRNSRILGSIFGIYEIIKDLKLKVSLGADLSNVTVNTYLPNYLEMSSSTNGSAESSQMNTVNWVQENTLNYIKSIGNHNFNILLGTSVQEQRGDRFSISTYDFFNNSTGYYNLSAGNNPQFPSSNTYKWSIVSFLGRFNYNLNQKYYLTISGRYDGSSRFGANNKFGFFPSGALAWRISEEPFLKDLNSLSNLKLRLSVGSTGNQEIPLYQTIQSYSTGGKYIFGGTTATSIVPGKLVDDNLKWEKTNQYDIGLDLGFFDNKLSLVADYYYKKTTDLLLNVQLPRQGGYTSALKNIGSVENQGVEIGLNTQIQMTKDLSWSFTGNISVNRNKVLELYGADKYFGSSVSTFLIGQNGGSVSVVKEGEPLGVFWGNIFDGLWQTQEEIDNGHMANNINISPGFENYRDVDGNGIFEEGLDETVIGDPNPDYEFSITNEINYKNIDFSFYIYSKQGNDVLNLDRSARYTTNVIAVNQSVLVNQAWDGPGTSNLIQKIDRPAGRSGDFPKRVSSNYIEDGSFIRLQNVTLGYTFNNSKLSFFKNARIYIAGENLYTWTDYSGYDPEVNSLGNSNTVIGVDMYAYPKARIIRGGIQVNF